jgi:hypothetical protein
MRLTRRSGKRTITIASRIAKVKSGGRKTFAWRLTRSQLRNVRTGARVLEIRAGTSATRIAPAKLSATIRFSGRLPKRLR